MSSIISGTSGFIPALAKIPLPLDKTVGNVKDATNFNAMEIQGYVTVVAGSTYRASVKVSVIKNGAGTYEVAATDIAGDDISGNPIVSFSMSGAMLQAQVSSSFGTVTNAEISFSVLNPSLNGEREASVDASAIVSGTLDSARMPEATSTAIGSVRKNRVLQKISGTTFGASATSILQSTNVPAGTYRVTMGAGLFKSADEGVARIFLLINGSRLIFTGSVAWEVGNSSSGSLTYEAQLDAGTSGTLIVTLSSVSSVSLDVEVLGTGGPSVRNPYYILEKLENYEEITSEWD